MLSACTHQRTREPENRARLPSRQRILSVEDNQPVNLDPQWVEEIGFSADRSGLRIIEVDAHVTLLGLTTTTIDEDSYSPWEEGSSEAL
jgi:hypothetical protein